MFGMQDGRAQDPFLLFIKFFITFVWSSQIPKMFLVISFSGIQILGESRLEAAADFRDPDLNANRDGATKPEAQPEPRRKSPSSGNFAGPKPTIARETGCTC